MPPRQLVVDDLPALQRRIAAEFEERARTAFASRGAFVVALPGGSVATAFFPALAATPVDWSRTDFFWIDERAVPPADPASNFSLAAALCRANILPLPLHCCFAIRAPISSATPNPPNSSKAKCVLR